VIAGMEAGCITDFQLNCRYQRGGMVVYSLIYCPNCFEDGFEVVFWKDYVIYFGDGNPHDAIFEFENYPSNCDGSRTKKMEELPEE